jgi:hypothetical protein
LLAATTSCGSFACSNMHAARQQNHGVLVALTSTCCAACCPLHGVVADSSMALPAHKRSTVTHSICRYCLRTCLSLLPAAMLPAKSMLTAQLQARIRRSWAAVAIVINTCKGLKSVRSAGHVD